MGPPDPPAGPPPLPPPGNPGQASWERFFWPLAFVVALALSAPQLVGYCASEETDARDAPNPELANPRRHGKEVRRIAVVLGSKFHDAWRRGPSANAEKLRAMADADALQSRGLLETRTLHAFLRSLLTPLHRALWKPDLAQRHLAGFAFANAVGFWLEVAGTYMGFMLEYVSDLGLLDSLYLGAGAAFYIAVCLELLGALAMSYLLFWSVTRADGEYQLLATGVYCVFGLTNVTYALMCTMGGVQLVRFLLYLSKALAALACVFYAFKIHEAGDEGWVMPERLPPPKDASGTKDLV